MHFCASAKEDKELRDCRKPREVIKECKLYTLRKSRHRARVNKNYTVRSKNSKTRLRDLAFWLPLAAEGEFTQPCLHPLAGYCRKILPALAPSLSFRFSLGREEEQQTAISPYYSTVACCTSSSKKNLGKILPSSPSLPPRALPPRNLSPSNCKNKVLPAEIRSSF